MLELFKIFKKKDFGTKDAAKLRIKNTLSFDRSACEETVKAFRDDLVAVLAQHSGLEAQGMEIKWSETENGILVFSIPVKRQAMRR